MKKLKYIIAAVLLIGFSASCTDMLDETSKKDIDKTKYLKNAPEALSVLQGVYRNMVTDALYGYHLSLMFPISDDLSQCEGSAMTNFREIPTNNHSASNSSIEQTWKQLYDAIYDANDFIETATANMVDFNEIDQELTKIYIAEARALRGLFYFELVKWFGNVTIMTKTSDSQKDPSEFIQDDPVEVYTLIESDLKHAAEILPWSTEDGVRPSSKFRFSRGAALGLLAKVYATWAGYPINDTSKWAEAAQTAQLVVTSGKHSLIPNYETVWKNTCNSIWDPSESLIEVSFYASAVTGTASKDPVGRIGKWNGVLADPIDGVRARNAGNVKVVYTFMKDWMTKNDPRYDLSVATYKYVGKNKVPFSTKEPDLDQKNWQICTPAKWDTEKYVEDGNVLMNADKSNINWYVLRYSDVLLIYAEAVNEANGAPTADAISAVNMVRRRGYGLDVNSAAPSVDISSAMGYEEFKQAVRKERAYELCFEGHRRSDLVRWGIYFETIRQTTLDLRAWFSSANYSVVENTIKGKHELLPIPRHELDLMVQYKPNPGW